MQTDQLVRQSPTGVNIPRYERIASAALGGAAIALGVRTRGLWGWLLAAGGAALTARGVAGRSYAWRVLATDGGVTAQRAITIRAPRMELYRFWRRLDNLPRFMDHVRSVTMEGEDRSRWVVEEGPMTLTWTTEITDDVEGRRIAWRSLPGSEVRNEGSVEFRDAPGDRGTEVHVEIRYQPPGGAVVAAPLRALLKRFTAHQFNVELARFRQLVEAGEIATGARRPDALEDEERKPFGSFVAPPPSLAGTPAPLAGEGRV